MTRKHSAAEIAAQLLIDAGIGSEVGAGLAWPVYVNWHGDTPCELIVLHDSQARLDGRAMDTGEYYSHCGFEVMIRSERYESGYRKLTDIIDYFDRAAIATVTQVGDTRYWVANANRTSGALYLGAEENSGRRLFAANFLIVAYEIS